MSVYEYSTTLAFNHVGEDHCLSYTGLVALLQEAAGTHADSLGFGLNNIDKTNLTWLLLYWKIRMFSSPKWNTRVTIRTWAREIAKVHSYRDFEVYDNKGNLIAIATSKWVLINASTHTIARVTPEISNTYGLVNQSSFPNFKGPNLKEPEVAKLTFTYTIGRRDIDRNNHVNNLYYLDFALESLPENVYQTNFKDIEVLYKKEIKLGSPIKCFYSHSDDKHIVTIKSEDLSILHAIIQLK